MNEEKIMNDMESKLKEVMRSFMEMLANKQNSTVSENITGENVEKPEITETMENAIVDPFGLPAELTKIAAEIHQLSEQIEDLNYKDKIIKEMHEELQKYKSGLRKEFITPLLKSIIREYDRAAQQYNFYLHKSQEELQNELFTQLLKEFNIVALGLLDLLENYNITPIQVNVGDNYDIKEHKIRKVMETEDAEKDGKIEKCIACGFRNMEDNILIRHAEVNIYKLKKQ